MSRVAVLGFLSAVGLAACSDPSSTPPSQGKSSAPAKVAVAPQTGAVGASGAAPAPAPAPLPASPPLPPLGQAINAAAPSAAAPAASATAAPDPLLVRVQVLLDRARFSPGSIDGRPGDNFSAALSAFQTAHGLPVTGAADAATYAALVQADPRPAATAYAIGPDDEAGPFLGKVPTEFKAEAKLKAMGYGAPIEGLAEKFHMSPTLLKRLNPDADFTAVGTVLLVAATVPNALPQPVAKVEVDKSARAVRAYDASGVLEAFFPASVGSTERPAPSGELKVKGVAQDPVYVYDPKRLTFGRKQIGRKLTIAAGPNNPVGVVWIALSRATYGIHGTPEPETVGKHQSHGCVRLTNWDAETLSRAVRPGVKVDFVGQDGASRAPGAPAPDAGEDSGQK